ncbi:MAG: hypothetical protein WD690_08630 [Vicinamibacterales bacterium]
MRQALAVILFLFEPFLAASLLLRVGPTLFYRDAVTLIAVAARVLLALASVAAAIGLRESRPYARLLTIAVLASSALFAVLQYFTRVLPTSLAPDVAPLVTAGIVVHHGLWIAWICFSNNVVVMSPPHE